MATLMQENHCGPEQQRKMATYFKEIFGELLLGEPLEDWPVCHQAHEVVIRQ